MLAVHLVLQLLAQTPERTLLLELEARDVEPSMAATAGSLVAVELSRLEGIDLVTGDELRRMIELEGEKQAAGCADTSCLAELAGALGAERVVFGVVSRVPSGLLVTLSAWDAKTNRATGRTAMTVPSVEDLPKALRAKLPALVGKEAATQAVSNGLPLALMIGGGVGVVAAAALVGVSFIPALAIADEEKKFLAGDGTAAQRTDEWHDWYTDGRVAGFQIGAVTTGALSVIALGVGAFLMTSASE